MGLPACRANSQQSDDGASESAERKPHGSSSTSSGSYQRTPLDHRSPELQSGVTLRRKPPSNLLSDHHAKTWSARLIPSVVLAQSVEAR